MADCERQLKESQYLAEKRAEDNFNLKERIDSQRHELEKLRKRAETLEDQVVQKEGELRMAKEDIERVQLKVKALMVPQNQSSRELEALKE